MADCERLKTCPFFNDQMVSMPAVTELIKRSYCLGDKMKCARYQVALAGNAVPTDLYPNDNDRAKQLLHRRQ